ncbi:hypothetical protein [Kitasatospora sp. NPDC101183]|uniref:hypothetical protein n=1 Tax=Kitasatospora sp. NPDC101183 TaxID=3364100 RepID=UPI0037FCB947
MIERATQNLSLPPALRPGRTGELEKHGTTMSAAVLMVMHRLNRTFPLRRGQQAMASVLGPGATIRTVLLASSPHTR